MTIKVVKSTTKTPQTDNLKTSVTVIERSSGWSWLQIRSLWLYRELLYFMVWREVKVRYKQTILGALWIVIQPVVSIVVFSILFGRLLNVDSQGVPYPIFAYAALLPWQYFASSLSRSSTSLVSNSQLITKVYFPRLIIPISSVLSGLVDFTIAFLVLAGMMLYYKIYPTITAMWLLPLLVVAALLALGVGLWLSALNVRFRDINYVVPFLVQIWMYTTPVVYGSTLIPERFRFLINFNPMTAVVEGFRWALLGSYLTDTQPIGPIFLISVLLTLAVLISGIIFFRTTERTFADIV